MSIKTFCRIVFGISFEHALKDDALWTVGDMFGSRKHFDAVVFERLFMDCRFILVARESVKFVHCHIFLWTL